MFAASDNDLDPRTRAELERRGVANVRVLIANDNWVGAGEQSAVEIGGGDIPKPSRAQVERWLNEQDQAAAALLTSRHRQVMLWAIAATIAGIIGVIIAVLQWMTPR
jgi:hypothetical protein